MNNKKDDRIDKLMDYMYEHPAISCVAFSMLCTSISMIISSSRTYRIILIRKGEK